MLIGCNTISEDSVLRTKILYAHTIQMGELSTDTQLQLIGLDMTELTNNDQLSTEEKIQELNNHVKFTKKIQLFII